MNSRTAGSTPPRVLVAPDKFRGSLSAERVAAALSDGFRSAIPDVRVLEFPIGDGGEGTVQTLLRHGWQRQTVEVEGPLGEQVIATWAQRGPLAVLEMSSVAGFSLVGHSPDSFTACNASTFGVGQLVTAALDAGAEEIVLGVAGSATTDGGAGALCALGLRLLDADGVLLPRWGDDFHRIARIDISMMDARLHNVQLIVAYDVDNPLLGAAGAAAVYGPQKGAGPDSVTFLGEKAGSLGRRMCERDRSGSPSCSRCRCWRWSGVWARRPSAGSTKAGYRSASGLDGHEVKDRSDGSRGCRGRLAR